MNAPTQRPRVLLVDDDTMVRFALRMLMDSLGWDHTEAASARAALERIQEGSYPFAIIDINMPETNGIELCHLMHANGQRPVPCIFMLSGAIDTRFRDAALKAGATSVLAKPIGRQELIDEMKKHGLPCKA
jgi:CheY-like chemotaxis protein